MIERRKFKREDISVIVVYKVDSPLDVRVMVKDKEVNAVALNLCEAGIALLTNYEIPASTIVAIRFLISKDATIRKGERYRTIEIKGEVCYNRFIKEEKAYRLGIRFINISDKERNFIANFIKHKLIPRDIKGGIWIKKN